MANSAIIRTIRLEPVGGPPAERIIASSDRVTIIGRQSGCDAVLPDQSVSRRHASLAYKGGSWILTDLGSKHGSFLNGVHVPPGESAPVNDADVIRLGPFSFRIGGPNTAARMLNTTADADIVSTRIHRIPQAELMLRAQHRLELLIDCAASITAATSEQQLAATVLDALMAGTGFARAAFVRRATAFDALGASQVELVASRGQATGENAFSRSLIEAAAAGQVVRLDEDSGVQDYGQSVMSLGIQAAICAPVMVDSAAVAFLYLDARRSEQRAPGSGIVQADAPAFCQAIARICGLALANLKRLELAGRQKQMEADLNAARSAQRLIMPKPTGNLGTIQYALRSRPGRFVAGDLVDIFPLQDGRVALLLGDVSGKGVGPALLMATAQAHLNASLRMNPDPARAAIEVNQHVAAHSHEGQFISLWVGVIDPAAGLLTFVDAGHGHWLVKFPDQPASRVFAKGGIPLGVDASADYAAEEIPFPRGSRLILYSDGLAEQQNSLGEEFGLDRILAALANSTGPDRDVATLFDALLNFAVPPEAASYPDHIALADDVTIVSTEMN
jgi:serine phosphatase RsbU (regulator of sigma subunit)